jgi:hypothetical protein
MYQTECLLGVVAAQNVKNWGTQVSTLPGSGAFELVGRDTLAGQFSGSKRTVQ